MFVINNFTFKFCALCFFIHVFHDCAFVINLAKHFVFLQKISLPAKKGDSFKWESDIKRSGTPLLFRINPSEC